MKGGLFGGVPNAPRSAGANGGLFGGVPNAPRSAGMKGGLGGAWSGAGTLDVDILNLKFRVVFLSEQKRPLIQSYLPHSPARNVQCWLQVYEGCGIQGEGCQTLGGL